MESAAIEVRGLSRRYGRRWALANVTLRAERGEVVMIAGRNGSGKSTLLRVLATAIRPDAGSAAVLGYDVVRERESVRRATALLSHYSYLYEALSARENLSLIGGAIDEALARVGLAERANDAVSTFSAGMRKRLSFARVLLQRPDVALLDEPYGALDPEGFALVDEVVAELRTRGATVVIATHQIERVAAYSDRVFTLDGGRLRA
ncbi:MAG: transporter involved in cytochrome c biosis, ATPase component CcmA [Acidobacteria bacterium]|nr:transporter involved in cytochrome c biosis, ATPase component CcmA [Acidobacteriota bacterium]